LYRTTQPAVSPVQQAERVQIVDILRGFALFGILFVNMTLFRLPSQTIILPANASAPWHDQAGMWLIHFLGESKFYSLFLLPEWLWRSLIYLKPQPMKRLS
jgi:uncharacterized protein